MSKRGKKELKVVQNGVPENEKKSSRLEEVIKPETDNDEKDLVNKMSEQERENESLIQEVVQDSDGTPADFSKIGWWLAIPRRDRFTPGDIVYHIDMDRFGIFVQPSRKEGLVKMRLFKLGSKSDVYTRDWYFPFELLTLVKHGNTVKRGFVETDIEYVKRAGKTPKKENVESVS